jgi:O-acetyl-ADP-ribose deacetylase (regulator of RNase III)
MIEIITGDLLEATEKYICHQTNCVSTGGAGGIARIIFDRFPYADCYTGRTENSLPGTLDIRGNGQDQRYVVNLHGQVYPGGITYPHSKLDGQEARRKHFYHGLLRLAKVPDLESVAFNWRIGCGIAGGVWEHYLGVLTNFADYVGKSNVKVSIYRREGDE